MIYMNLFPGGKPKALTMSYDDGHVQDRRLVDIFNRYGIKGTFHLISGKLDQDTYIASSEVAQLFRGHEISAHTQNHPWISCIPKEQLLSEVIEDRRNLEVLAGYPIRGMSYPFGDVTYQIAGIIPNYGIEYARTTISTKDFFLPEDFLKWHPTCHHNENLLEMTNEFLNKEMVRPDGMLLYVWGHSNEFDRNGNWELMERFCERVQGNEDIWFATNIQIVDYVNAQRHLRFSLNCDSVYNPSAVSVWFTLEGEKVEVKPGMTIGLK